MVFNNCNHHAFSLYKLSPIISGNSARISERSRCFPKPPINNKNHPSDHHHASLKNACQDVVNNIIDSLAPTDREASVWQWCRKTSSAHFPLLNSHCTSCSQRWWRDMSRSPSPTCSVFSRWNLLFVARERLNPTTLHLCILDIMPQYNPNHALWHEINMFLNIC